MVVKDSMRKILICILITLTTVSFVNSSVIAEPNFDVGSDVEIGSDIGIDITSIEDSIRKLDSEIVTSIINIETLNNEIADNEKIIEDKNKEINDILAEIEKQSQILSSRVRGMYKEGDFDGGLSIITKIVNSKSIIEAINNIEMFAYITKMDKDLIDRNRERKIDLEVKLKEAEVLEEELLSKKYEMEIAMEELEEKKRIVEQTLEDSLEIIQEERAKREEAARIEYERLEQERLERERLEQERLEQERLEQERLEQEMNSSASSGNNGNSNSGYEGSSGPQVSYDSATGSSIVSAAMNYLGVPYVWGGESLEEGGFDCSGLVQHVYGLHGIYVPRVSESQQFYGKQISFDELMPGDLIFWGTPAWHVGIYIGGGQYIHAPQPGDVIRIAYMDRGRLSSACRVLY